MKTLFSTHSSATDLERSSWMFIAAAVVILIFEWTTNSQLDPYFWMFFGTAIAYRIGAAIVHAIENLKPKAGQVTVNVLDSQRSND